MSGANPYYAGCLPCAKGTHVATLEAANQWIVRHWKSCPQSKRFKPTNVGVAPREKYAQLEAVGEERPLCECHGKPMVWSRRVDYKAGGYWDCTSRMDKVYAPTL